MAPKAIEEALYSYVGLPHRCQILGKYNGVTFVNDSKATNADAAEKRCYLLVMFVGLLVVKLKVVEFHHWSLTFLE